MGLVGQAISACCEELTDRIFLFGGRGPDQLSRQQNYIRVVWIAGMAVERYTGCRKSGNASWQLDRFSVLMELSHSENSVELMVPAWRCPVS